MLVFLPLKGQVLSESNFDGSCHFNGALQFMNVILIFFL